MPTLKVKQNGEWKNIFMSVNGSNNSDTNIIVVTYDPTTMLANYSSSEILAYVNDKKNIIIQHEEVLYSLSHIEEELAVFYVNIIKEDIITTTFINIDNEKNVTKTTSNLPTEDRVIEMINAAISPAEGVSVFTSQASGRIPEYETGTALSELTLNFESSAIGALQEE